MFIASFISLIQNLIDLILLSFIDFIFYKNRIYSYVYVCSNFKQLEDAYIFQKAPLLPHVIPPSALKLATYLQAFRHKTMIVMLFCFYSFQHILLLLVMLMLPLNIIKYKHSHRLNSKYIPMQ